MTWRTPPSLKWLIVKRSRTSGLISRLTEERDSLSARLDRINQLIPRLERQLQALDVTFELHDIQIEPTDIAPVVPHKAVRLLPFGQLGRVMLRAMRKHGTWIPTTVLAVEVRAAMPDGLRAYDEIYLRRAIRRRLGALLKEGRVERLLDNALAHDDRQASSKKRAPAARDRGWLLSASAHFKFDARYGISRRGLN